MCNWITVNRYVFNSIPLLFRERIYVTAFILEQHFSVVIDWGENSAYFFHVTVSKATRILQPTHTWLVHSLTNLAVMQPTMSQP